MGDKGHDDIVQLTHHNVIELVDSEIYPVIGNPALGEIIGSDTFTPVP